MKNITQVLEKVRNDLVISLELSDKFVTDLVFANLQKQKYYHFLIVNLDNVSVLISDSYVQFVNRKQKYYFTFENVQDVFKTESIIVGVNLKVLKNDSKSDFFNCENWEQVCGVIYDYDN